MNWLRHVKSMLVADVSFYYMPKRILAVIPKTALEHNTVLINKSEDGVNIYLEFQIKDAVQIGKDYTISETGKETTSNLQRFGKRKGETY